MRKAFICKTSVLLVLFQVKPASIEDDPKDESVTSTIPKVYLKALSMVEFDSFLVTHSATTKVDVQELSEKIIGKRKYAGKIEAPIKRRKGHPAYFLPGKVIKGEKIIKGSVLQTGSCVL